MGVATVRIGWETKIDKKDHHMLEMCDICVLLLNSLNILYMKVFHN